ncbi:TTLL8_3 [Blepharisma stoltei]|uniref:Tubulin glycylase 3A n=1 Tax=Blepharisma stoltei TaxID=1481888 RepID=A0AAU9IQ70_9CILI|nr:unnamed protein product [Blepharisma stoltei]
MSEEVITERQGRPQLRVIEYKTHSSTTSPPNFQLRPRNRSTDAPSSKNINFHERNIKYLKTLKEKKDQRLQDLEQEKQKLEITRQRLASLILKRNEVNNSKEERPKTVCENAKEEENDDKFKTEDFSESSQKSNNFQNYYRSRYHTLLETLQENNKYKQQLKEIEEQKKLNNMKKLKEDLGFVNVSSKLFNPTISSMINSNNLSESEIAELKASKYASFVNVNKPKPKPQTPFKPAEDDKIKQKLAREAAEKIFRRAQEHLNQLAERKMIEAKKESEAKDRELRMRQALKESVLNKVKTNVVSKEELPAPQQSPVKKPKKSDEKILQRLVQVPKRWPGCTITDISIFRKKYKLSEKDKIFVINGTYPDIRKALLDRDWFENPDVNSPCFDLIWTVRRKDIDFPNLQEHQLCNHFDESTTITTKAGLSKNLKNLIWFCNVDIDTFYPRCFEVSEQPELDDFITEFKALRAEALLKKALSGIKIKEEKLRIAISICQRRLKDLDELVDDPNIDGWELVKEDEWAIISDNTKDEDLSGLENPHLLQQAREIAQLMMQKFPQFNINGCLNIWIVKPAGLSRGRGINCYNNLSDIQNHIQKEGGWVVQKYIENPKLILRKKFDIRQWVLVTCWNPLTVWFYERCYLRFGVEDFTFDDLSNNYVHLTNNSIQKNSELFYSSEIEGCMWHSEEFAEYLREETGRDLWEEDIKPRIKNIVKHSLECVQDMIDNRKNSSELFGFDIMIDDNNNPWLIEVNASPAMDYSTQVTEELVHLVMEDTIKVMVDYHFASKKKKHIEIDTGNFSLLFKPKGPVEKPIQSYGLNLLCEGKAIKSFS